MKTTGAALARHALEQLGVRHTFGIPGVHNTELYDELNASAQITPVLVTHECGGAFMADAISRTSEQIGVLAIVPAAGVTHAASGIGEAFLAGVPLLVIAGGIHSTSGRRYQLHDMDQHALLAPITKATFRIATHRDVIPMIYEAHRIATTGEPGPVFVELPVDIANFLGDVDDLPAPPPRERAPDPDPDLIEAAARALVQSERPGIFAGWGSVGAQADLIALAEWLDAPVSTTLQGLSAFPARHPLHTGMGFGEYAVPAADNAFRPCDALLVVGARFAEIPTGSYGISPPATLVHIDINGDVFDANYPASVALEGDARTVVPALLAAVRRRMPRPANRAIRSAIAADKQRYQAEWEQHDSQDRVNPGRFFAELRRQLAEDAIVVADDGNHTFLTAELMPIQGARRFISPSDFNAMGYCVPAAIGAKLVNPGRQVVGIVGDGAVLMTGMEMLTAARLGLGVVACVFSDGELSQIAQAQALPYNRKTCSVLGNLQVKGLADATGAQYVPIHGDADIEVGLREALACAAGGRPVFVDVRIDYSKATRFTKGVIKANVARFALRDKVRIIGRALVRKVTG